MKKVNIIFGIVALFVSIVLIWDGFYYNDMVVLIGAFLCLIISLAIIWSQTIYKYKP